MLQQKTNGSLEQFLIKEDLKLICKSQNLTFQTAGFGLNLSDKN
jgi:hypothetical protein